MGGRSHPQINQHESNLYDVINIQDLCNLLNERHVAPARRDPESFDGFPCFSNHLNAIPYAQKFKPNNINKYDGRGEPTQWLHWYSTTINLAREDEDVKVIYLPMILKSTLPTWFEQLPRGSIHSRLALSKKIHRKLPGGMDLPSQPT